MPNIIINNFCNQKCSYCFANKNMEDKSLQKEMSLKTYVSILKYLKFNNDKAVRILGGEPLLSLNISNFLKISIKGGFNVILFSNINISNSKMKQIFEGLKGKIRINCNINDEDFYNKNEIINIEKNLEFFQEKGINIILGYNIININRKPEFLLKLAKKYKITAVNLKITNTELGNNLIIDNSKKELGTYIYNFIIENYKYMFIEISCGLDKTIFSKIQLSFILNIAKINLKYGCEGNIGKFDINTDGSIFKCYPLKTQFNNISIFNIIRNNIKIESVNKFINMGFYSNGICSAHTIKLRKS